jgi:hypothetical protein
MLKKAATRTTKKNNVVEVEAPVEALVEELTVETLVTVEALVEELTEEVPEVVEETPKPITTLQAPPPAISYGKKKISSLEELISFRDSIEKKTGNLYILSGDPEAAPKWWDEKDGKWNSARCYPEKIKEFGKTSYRLKILRDILKSKDSNPIPFLKEIRDDFEFVTELKSIQGREELKELNDKIYHEKNQLFKQVILATRSITFLSKTEISGKKGSGGFDKDLQNSYAHLLKELKFYFKIFRGGTIPVGDPLKDEKMAVIEDVLYSKFTCSNIDDLLADFYPEYPGIKYNNWKDDLPGGDSWQS